MINSVYRFLAILKWKISVRYEISFLVVFSIKYLFFCYISENIVYIKGGFRWLTLFAE